MIIHCTKKLAVKLKNVSDVPLSGKSEIGDWHANLYTVDRRQCLLFCHDKTRFTLFMAGLKKPDFENLNYWFSDVYANVMLKLEYDRELIERAMSKVDDLRFDASCDRSVQGTMNIAMRDLQAMAWQVSNVLDLPPYSTSAWLNRRPVRTKSMKSSECMWPVEAMDEFIRSD